LRYNAPLVGIRKKEAQQPATSDAFSNFGKVNILEAKSSPVLNAFNERTGRPRLPSFQSRSNTGASSH
jgi:hypothetical protein